MVDYGNIEQRLSETHGLPRRPIAVTFRDTPPMGVPKFTGTEPSGCSFWKACGGRAYLLHRPQRSLQLRDWELHA